MTDFDGVPVRIAELNYELPDELIARHPCAERDGSRLMVVRADGLEHRVFSELVELIPAGALLVVNDTRVRAARLFGHKHPSGGRVEVLLVRQQPNQPWEAMARSSKKLRNGTELHLADSLRAEVVAETDEHGLLRLRLWTTDGQEVNAAVAEQGHMPLPPYLGRDSEPADIERYQTVFAKELGAVAAPTAGLHFTSELLAALTTHGVQQAAITLHVGPGTFRPVSHDSLDDHPMHHEYIDVGEETVAAIAAARHRNAPVIAVGTTVVRALETAADPEQPGLVGSTARDTDLLIQPGYDFKVVDGLITNFHLPKSTLLALVFAFAGSERVREAYRQAIGRKYRFYSYGDAMFIPRRCADTLPTSENDS